MKKTNKEGFGKKDNYMISTKKGKQNSSNVLNGKDTYNLKDSVDSLISVINTAYTDYYLKAQKLLEITCVSPVRSTKAK